MPAVIRSANDPSSVADSSPSEVKAGEIPVKKLNSDSKHEASSLRAENSLASSRTFEPTFDLSGKQVDAEVAHSSAASSHDHHSHAQTEHTIPALLAQTRSSIPQQRSFAISQLVRIVQNSFSVNRVTQSLRTFYDLALNTIRREPHLGTFIAGINLLHVVCSHSVFISTIGEAVEELGSAVTKILTRHIENTDTRSFAHQCAIDLLKVVAQTDFASVLYDDADLLDLLVKKTLAKRWPMEGDDRPLASAICLLEFIARQARKAAELVAQTSAINVLSRYLALPYWQVNSSDEPQTAIGREVTIATFSLLQTLAQYGLACETRSAYSSIWNAFEGLDWRGVDRETTAAWLSLMRVWMIAALQPHEHDHAITWSQVGESIGSSLFAHADLIEDSTSYNDLVVLVDLLRCWAVWLEGAKFAGRNDSELPSQLQSANLQVLAESSCTRLLRRNSSNILHNNLEIRLLCAILDLHPFEMPQTPQLLDILLSQTNEDTEHTFDRVHLVTNLISNSANPSIGAIFETLPHIQAGEEIYGQRLVRVLCKTLSFDTHSIISCFGPSPGVHYPGVQLGIVERLEPSLKDRDKAWGKVWPLKVPLDALLQDSRDMRAEDVVVSALQLSDSMIGQMNTQQLPSSALVVQQLMRIYTLSGQSVAKPEDRLKIATAESVKQAMATLLKRLPILPDQPPARDTFKSEYSLYLDSIQGEFPDKGSAFLALVPAVSSAYPKACKQILHEEHRELAAQVIRTLSLDASDLSLDKIYTAIVTDA